MNNFRDKLNCRTWLEISKKAIDNNIAQYKKIAGDKIIAPVIKSNAYGHGLVEVARICEQNKDISWMCVANSDEAILLRKNGIKKNILNLSYVGHQAQELAIGNVSLALHDLESAISFNEIGKKLNKKINVHVKVDTGLSRLGFLPKDVVAFIVDAKNSFHFINIEGLWTHLTEPAIEDREFTNLQVSRFTGVVKELKGLGINIEYIHFNNSAGILTIDSEYDNFFRPGISLYGYWPSEYIKEQTIKKYPDFKLEPSMSWKTRIFCIREIEAENFIGYNRTFLTTKTTKIALIPVGYYDGYDRRFSNVGPVIINGQKAKIAGLVCMNVMMIDITDLKDINIGDEVILIGGKDEVNVNNLATSVGMNPRDLTAKISLEVPRFTDQDILHAQVNSQEGDSISSYFV